MESWPSVDSEGANVNRQYFTTWYDVCDEMILFFSTKMETFDAIPNTTGAPFCPP